LKLFKICGKFANSEILQDKLGLVMSYDERARARQAALEKKKADKAAEIEQAIAMELLDYLVTSQQNKCFEICGTKEKFLKDEDDPQCMINCWNSYREAYLLTLAAVSPNVTEDLEEIKE